MDRRENGGSEMNSSRRLLNDLFVQRQQGLAVMPADIGIHTLGKGTNPGLGSTEAASDKDLRFAGGENLVDDGFPVHGAEYRKCDMPRQRHCDIDSYHNRDMKTETLGQRVARLRTDRGLTQKQLADAAGLGQSTIAGMEKDARDKAPSSLIEIAHALGVDAYWLKTGKGIAPGDQSPKAEEQRGSYQHDPKTIELAALINRIPEAERQAMIAMLRTRFGTEDNRQRRESAKKDALTGFADVTEKPNKLDQQEHK